MSSSEPILSEFFTKEELALELRRNKRTLDRWEVLGMGPPRTLVGRQILYRRSSVRRWLVAQENHRGWTATAPEKSTARELRGAV
jgi:hypothetical protein